MKHVKPRDTIRLQLDNWWITKAKYQTDNDRILYLLNDARHVNAVDMGSSSFGGEHWEDSGSATDVKDDLSLEQVFVVPHRVSVSQRANLVFQHFLNRNIVTLIKATTYITLHFILKLIKLMWVNIWTNLVWQTPVWAGSDLKLYLYSSIIAKAHTNVTSYALIDNAWLTISWYGNPTHVCLWWTMSIAFRHLIPRFVNRGRWRM